MPSLNFAESLDHFVVPVDDIVVAEEFYVARLRRRDHQAQRLERPSTQARRGAAHVYSDRRQTHGRVSAK